MAHPRRKSATSLPDPDLGRVPRERRSVRVPLEAEITLRRPGQQTYRVRVHDASPHGCKVEFVERPRLDERVWVKFDGLEALESLVCWVDGFVAGVEFVRPIYPAVFNLLVQKIR